MEDKHTEDIETLLKEIQKLRTALTYVKDRIEESDAWWMTSPNKGGFDMEIINKALE